MSEPFPQTSFPLAVIDFEATALSLESFPIEVGLAVIPAPGAQIATWSSLIKPDPTWNMDVQWDPDAERIHGISRWSLRDGAPPHAVMAELNARIPAHTAVWCDGGHYDQCWLDALAAAAHAAPSFKLADLGAALRNDAALGARYLSRSANQPRPHRAGADAELICLALAAALRL